MSDIAKMLAAARNAWKDVPVFDRGLLPDGKYQFKLVQLEGKSIITTDSDGAIRARIGLEVVISSDESLVGKKTTKSWTLFRNDEPDEIGLSFLKSDLSVLGLAVDEIDATSLPDALTSILGLVVNGSVVTKQDEKGIERQNVYINSLAHSREESTKPSKKRLK